VADETTSSSSSKKSKKADRAQAKRDMHSDDDAQIRDDVPVAAEMRLVPDAGDAVGEDQVDEMVEKEQEAGFRGATADPTPNENYTVAGVTQGKPTPETHFGQRRAARAARTFVEGVEPY